MASMGLIKVASIDVNKLQNLSSPNIFNKVEELLTPEVPSEDAELKSRAEAAISKEKDYLRKRYNVNPTLVGSLPLNLHIPNDVDLDFFINVKSPKKYTQLVNRIKNNPKYQYSPYNKDPSAYHVFRRDAESEKDFPVDLAIGYGEDAEDYVSLQRKKTKTTSNIPEGLRQKIIQKKNTLKHTPFDFKGKRYKKFKRELEDATGGVIRLERQAHDDLLKQAGLVDLSSKPERERFERFINRKDVYGHRTNHIDSVAADRHLLSALDALRSNKLKSYEAGVSAGDHQKIQSLSLTPNQIKELRSTLLQPVPDLTTLKELAKEKDVNTDDIKREYLRNDFHKIKKFLNTLPNGEAFRKKHLSIPKLGPNIFLTRGGVLDQEGYGDSAVLVRNLTATKSPFMNLLTGEHIVKPKRVLTPRKVPLGKGYVLAPSTKAKDLSKNHPDLNIIDLDKMPKSLKDKTFKPTRSYKEIPSRWLPNLISQDFSTKATH